MNASFMTFQPASRPTKVVPRRSSTVTTSARRTPPSLARNSPGSAPTATPSSPKRRARIGGVGVEVQRPLALVQRSAEAAAHVDLRERAAGVEQRLRHPRHRLEGGVERGQLVVQHAVGEVHVQRVDREAVTTGGVEGGAEVLLVDAELGRPGAAVQALGVAAHDAAARVDAQADGRARAAAAVALDLAEQVEVHVHAGGRDDVEVALRDVGAGEADLGGGEPVLEGVPHLARRAGVDADAAG